jgi:hypothetical protein
MTRTEAKAAGLAKYETDRPCKNGHTERYVRNGGCTVCTAIRNRRPSTPESRKKLAEWMRVYKREARAKRKRQQEYQRAYYLKRKAAIAAEVQL